MVQVKVRETYDLHTTRNKMTVIGIHTPKPDIIKRNYPGLLMQCKAYRPVSADVRIACASVLPLDPKGVGLTENDVAPEDVFNPILYKAMSNFGMSQLEARINAFRQNSLAVDVAGSTADVDTNTLTAQSDEFDLYYGLLAETNNWKHAHPQSGLTMRKLKPLVWEIVYNVGDNSTNTDQSALTGQFDAPLSDGNVRGFNVQAVRGGSKPFPFINTLRYTTGTSGISDQPPGFDTNWNGRDRGLPVNAEQDVPWINVVVGAIIVPPSRLHEMFYRMVVEWTLEFTAIRSILDITQWDGIAQTGRTQHYQNYDYSQTKKAVTGDDSTILESDSCMVSSNVDIEKVM